MDWVSGGLGAWGTGTGPQGNLLLREGRATCYRRDKQLEREAALGYIYGGDKFSYDVPPWLTTFLMDWDNSGFIVI